MFAVQSGTLGTQQIHANSEKPFKVQSKERTALTMVIGWIHLVACHFPFGPYRSPRIFLRRLAAGSEKTAARCSEAGSRLFVRRCRLAPQPQPRFSEATYGRSARLQTISNHDGPGAWFSALRLFSNGPGESVAPLPASCWRYVFEAIEVLVPVASAVSPPAK